MNRFYAKSLVSFSLFLIVEGGCSKRTTNLNKATKQDASLQAPGVNEKLPLGKESEVNSNEALLKNYSTYEQQYLQAAIEKAKKEGKLLMVDVSSVWCGPCQIFKRFINEQSSEIGDVFNQYNFVMVEEAFYQFQNVTEFIPFKIPYYPSILLFNPQTGAWSAGDYDLTAPQWTSALQAFQQGNSLLNWSIETLKKSLESDDVATFYFPSSLVQTIVVEHSDAESAQQKLEEILSLLDSKAEFVLKATGSATLQEFKQSKRNDLQGLLLSSGKINLESFIANNKARYLELAKSDPLTALDDSQWTIFLGALSAEYRKGGLPSALETCEKISEVVKREFTFAELSVPENASEEEKKNAEETNKAALRMLKFNEADREAQCLQFKSLARKTSAQDVLDYVNRFEIENPSLDTVNPTTHLLIQLAVSTGTELGYAKAKELNEIHARKRSETLEEFMKQLEQLLAEAKAKNDLDNVKYYELRIEGEHLTEKAVQKAHEALAAAFEKNMPHPYALVP